MKRMLLFLFAVAVGLAAVNAQVTQGRIGNGNITISGTPWTDVYGLDFNNDGVLEIRISDFSGDPSVYNGYFSYNWEDGGTNILADENVWDYVGVLEGGVTIGAASASLFAGYGDAAFDSYGTIALGTHYLGFRIKLADGVHYGYAKYTMAQEGGDYRATFTNCYYNATVGAGIVTGDEGSTQGIGAAEGTTKIAIYPNTATDWVSVNMDNAEGATVSIMDVSGHKVMSTTLEEGSAKLNVESLAKGAYFVRIDGEKVSVVRKLIVK